MKLFAIILTLNEADHIAECIQSLNFADHIIVVDSQSSDDTTQRAEAEGAEVILHPFTDYANQRNFALDHVQGRADWVLFVDADERVTSELADAVRTVRDKSEYAGWQIPRHNYLFGKLTTGAGWYPDYQTRLLRVGSAKYDPHRKVHEVVMLDGELGTLDAHFIHYNYRDVHQFMEKQRKYTAYEAQILYEQGHCPKPQNYILQPLRHFKWRYFELRGFTNGLHGLRLSVLMAWFELKKFLILRELCNKKTGA
mgnify:CR=1 FL=1